MDEFSLGENTPKMKIIGKLHSDWLFSLPIKNDSSVGDAFKQLCAQTKPRGFIGKDYEIMMSHFGYNQWMMRDWLNGQFYKDRSRFNENRFRQVVEKFGVTR